jgi:hypothetical protein
VEQREAQLSRLKIHLANAQNHMKQQTNKNRSEKAFQVGDNCLLKLQTYAQSSVANRPFPKLAFKYYGPFKILEKIGAVAYKLELPATAPIHLVFHVSQLKEFTHDFTPVFHELPKVAELDITDTTSEEILDRRLVKEGNKAVPQVMIKWTDLLAEAATWEDLHVCKHRFSSTLAWGQASFSMGGTVTHVAQGD